LRSFALAVSAGLALAMAYQPYGYWFLAPLAWALLIFIIHKLTIKDKFFAGFLFGIAFWLIQINWLTVLGIPVLVITAFAISLFYGLFSALTTMFSSAKFWPVYYALTFLSLEVMLNYWPLGGFNWGSLGYISSNHPLLELVEVTGVFGLSILLMSLSVTFIIFFLLISKKAYVAGVVGLSTWLLLIGIVQILVIQNKAFAPSGVLTIAAIQGNVPRLGLEFNAQRKAVYENHVNETEKLLRDNPNVSLDLIVWPENAPDVDPFANPEVIDQLNAISLSANSPLLVGSRMTSDIGAINASILIDGDTTSENAFIYAKQKLVPFGERIPLENILGPIAANFGPISENLVAGNQPGLLPIRGAVVGLMICFEVAWGQVAYEVVKNNAQVLLIQTNNATYGLTGQLQQQSNIARLRSIEAQREVITVATSGISAHFDKSGNTLWEAPEFISASKILSVKLYDGVNLGIKVNFYSQIFIIFIMLFLILFIPLKSRIKHYVK
jgi:apolipoprotein N-acyltransferase